MMLAKRPLYDSDLPQIKRVKVLNNYHNENEQMIQLFKESQLLKEKVCELERKNKMLCEELMYIYTQRRTVSYIS